MISLITVGYAPGKHFAIRPFDLKWVEAHDNIFWSDDISHLVIKPQLMLFPYRKCLKHYLKYMPVTFIHVNQHQFLSYMTTIYYKFHS